MSDKEQSDFYSNVIVLDFDEQLGDLDQLKRSVRDDAATVTEPSPAADVDIVMPETSDSTLEDARAAFGLQDDERLYRGDLVDFFARYCDSEETSLHFQALMGRAREEKAKLFLWKPPGDKVKKPELLDLMEAFGAVVMVLPGD
jgi:hypothetical protein